jgi:hypothetical protein
VVVSAPFRGRHREDRLRISRRAKRIRARSHCWDLPRAAHSVSGAIHPKKSTQCSTSSLPCLRRNRRTRNMTWWVGCSLFIRPSSELSGCGAWPVGAEYRHGRPHTGPGHPAPEVKCGTLPSILPTASDSDSRLEPS